MARLELDMEFVIRAEPFILDQTNESCVLSSDWVINSGIGWGYVTARTCVELWYYPFETFV